MLSRFFFDCYDGKDHLIDDHGIGLAGEYEAREHAVALVQSLLSEEVSKDEAKIVNVTVRAAYGPPIYIAHCAFTGFWTKDRALKV